MLQAFAQLLRRYPLSAGTVCLLNFGWIYQGLWQMVKLLLTEEAKNRVAFPKVKELYDLMPHSKLVKGKIHCEKKSGKKAKSHIVYRA